MNHHHSLLRNLGIDPQSNTNLFEIENPFRPLHGANQFQPVNESNQYVYQFIVDHFLQKHMFSYELDAIKKSIRKITRFTRRSI